MRAARFFHSVVAGLAVVALTSCDSPSPAQRPSAPSNAVYEPEQPSGARPVASAESRALQVYYAQVQNDLQVRGLLRTDGGGPDTAFTDTMLVRNFENIALAEEYERGAGLKPSSGTPSAIKKWTRPIRMTAEFGASVPPAQAQADRARVGKYAARLARVTGHPIQMTDQNANFHVLFVSEDEKHLVSSRIKQLVPDVAPGSLRVLDDLPRSIHCLVVAFSSTPGGYDYGQAIAVIRSEHPDLLRLSCIHEEIAQGLGLGNDDPRARPSIFNDDDEFALLTRHDEMLLEILYDPRLRPGMTREQARPIVVDVAEQLVGSPMRLTTN